MRFIPKEKYSIINELSKKGDEKAKDFLSRFMEMEDDEANNYLSSLQIDDNEIKNGYDFLIKDENEAIDGYDKQIKLVQNSDIDERKKIVIINTLQHIKEEELEHIEELKKLKGE